MTLDHVHFLGISFLNQAQDIKDLESYDAVRKNDLRILKDRKMMKHLHRTHGPDISPYPLMTYNIS